MIETLPGLPDYSPTQSCFDDAIDFLHETFKANKLESILMNYRLCHGICNFSDPYSHAWVEVMDKVWDCGIYQNEKCYFEMPKDFFYRHFRITDVTRYTVEEMIAQNTKFEHYGPWEKRYFELCKDVKEGRKKWKDPTQ